MSKTIAVMGLGTMGAGLALRCADCGLQVVAFDPEPGVRKRLAAVSSIEIVDSFHELAKKSGPATPLLMMIPANHVDAALDELLPLLNPGQIVIDGGNSHYEQTEERAKRLSKKRVIFCGTGVSGGIEGARNGPAIMVGGEAEGADRVVALLSSVAASAAGEPCIASFGYGGGGHFVKAVHNGIEYAIMQILAEGYSLLTSSGRRSASDAASAMERWKEFGLGSYLLDITVDVLTRVDPESRDNIVNLIKDQAPQGGTGRWTAEAALEFGVPALTLLAAVDARSLSMMKEDRLKAASLIPAPSRVSEDPLAATIGKGVAAAVTTAYAQGFTLLVAGREKKGWRFDLSSVAKVWRSGCILRSDMMEALVIELDADRELTNPMLGNTFAASHLKALRETVAASALGGVATPCLNASLAHVDGLRNPSNSSAALIQAQRDHFGHHGFERTDRSGTHHLPPRS